MSLTCFRKRQFVHNIFVHDFCAPEPPPPNQQSDGFPLQFPELRTLSQNYKQTNKKNPPKNANRQNYEQTGVSDVCANLIKPHQTSVPFSTHPYASCTQIKSIVLVVQHQRCDRRSATCGFEEVDMLGLFDLARI